MDRRLFLTGMLGLTGAAVVATTFRPAGAVAGVPNGRGILDELETSLPDLADDGSVQAEVLDIAYHRRRRRRRAVWRRVCRRYYRHGRWYRRCQRQRVWVWYWG